MNKIKLSKVTWLAFVVAIFLVGCGKIEESNEAVASEQAQSQVVKDLEPPIDEDNENTTVIDQRFVPEFSQVVADLSSSEDLTIADEVFFSINESFIQTQNNFQLSVDNMQVYEVEKAAESVISEFNYEDNPGAVVLMEVAITNLTDETIYYPIEGCNSWD